MFHSPICFKKTLFFLFLSLLSHEVVAQQQNKVIVRASDYCHFLNNMALSGESSFYNEAMGSDPDTACIVPIETAGAFHYEVIEGREEASVKYVSSINKENYDHWVNTNNFTRNQLHIQREEGADCQLASNKVDFSLLSSEEILSMGSLQSSSLNDSKLQMSNGEKYLLLIVALIAIHNEHRSQLISGTIEKCCGKDEADLLNQEQRALYRSNAISGS